MIGSEDTNRSATHPMRMGEQWQVSAACVSTPLAAASMLRAAWSKPEGYGMWPAGMHLLAGSYARPIFA